MPVGKALAAALLYFALVFGAGFLLGPIRVLLLEPRLGATLAVLCEAPVMLAAIVAAARWVPGRIGLTGGLPALAVMGAVALALQQAADIALGALLRGITPAAYLANFATPAGLVYAVLLVAFLVMPMLVARAR